MTDYTLPDGQFMGHTVTRMQVLAGDRSFTAIPISWEVGPQKPMWGASGGIPRAGQADDMMDALQYGIGVARSQGLSNSSFANAVGAHAAFPAHGAILSTPYQPGKALASQILPSGPSAPPLTISYSPNRAGKSISLGKMREVVRGMQAHSGPGITVPFKAPKNLTSFNVYSGLSILNESWTIQTHMQRSKEKAWRALDVKAPHPERSAHELSDKMYPVPLLKISVPPVFFSDNSVSAALKNSVDAVCAGTGGRSSLAAMVRNWIRATYRPKGIYRPDIDAPISGQITGGLFSRDTIPLLGDAPFEPLLDVRYATGVYQLGSRAWLGVFVFGVGTCRTPPSRYDPLGQSLLSPTEPMKKMWCVEHRGQTDPHTLYFDMFVPVEPEAVTQAWGWGEGLEDILEKQSANTVKEAKDERNKDERNKDVPSYRQFAAYPWNRKAREHKSRIELAKAQAAIDLEAYELGQAFKLATEKRERARAVLHKYAWKALMLAIIECKQLTLEELK